MSSAEKDAVITDFSYSDGRFRCNYNGKIIGGAGNPTYGATFNNGYIRSTIDRGCPRSIGRRATVYFDGDTGKIEFKD